MCLTYVDDIVQTVPNQNLKLFFGKITNLVNLSVGSYSVISDWVSSQQIKLQHGENWQHGIFS
jgi:hypothetical protein